MPRWGMVIDLDKCTTCGACVAACKAENNIPSSTPSEARQNRGMFWMEVIRFVEGEEPSDARIRYVPRPCMHCENPPCIKVCPVRATYLTEEGFVAQIYHRCIGCRYCTAACPYTVKIFNWFEPQTWNKERAHSLNPDVSLRPVGVVEKCTFCHHRYQIAKDRAKLEQRALNEQDYRVACQDVCPAQAIYFGDLDDETTQVHQQSRSTRAWRMLEDIGTEPKVYYLSTGE